MSEPRHPAQALPAEPGGRVAPAESTVVKWECQLTDGQGVQPKDVTVGTKLVLKCSGPSVSDWKAPARFVFPKPEDEFSLAILQTNRASVNEGEWIVAGYKPGNHQPEWLEITDGSTSVRAENLTWSIASVIQPKPGEKAEPFAPFGPVSLFWPLWIWLTLGGLILAISALIFMRIRRQRARKALLERLAVKGTVLTPYVEFHKTLRQLTRKHPEKPEEYLHQLDQSFRYFLTREFLIPADEWPMDAVLSDLKKRHKVIYKSLGSELSTLLREFKRASGAKQVSLGDCEQLQEISRKVVDRIHSEKGPRP